MKVLMPDEVKEQGILTKKDLEQIIKVLRFEYVSDPRRLELAEKLAAAMQEREGK